MNQQQFLRSLEDSFSSCLIIARAKNSDYSSGVDPYRNFRSAEIAGVSVERAILVRILDKLSRVSNLLDKEAQVKDEAITDTLLDMINYSAILKSYLEDNGHQ